MHGALSTALAAWAVAPVAPRAQPLLLVKPQRLRCPLHLNFALVLLLILNHTLLAKTLLHSTCPPFTTRPCCVATNELFCIIRRMHARFSPDSSKSCSSLRAFGVSLAGSVGGSSA